MSLATGNLRAPLKARGMDLYQTPVVAVEALLRVEALPHRLWEPAAGRGAIVNVLRAAGHEVLASDLVDYGDPTHFARRDFLIERKVPDGSSASSRIHRSGWLASLWLTRWICIRASSCCCGWPSWNRSVAATFWKIGVWRGSTFFAGACR